MQQQTTVDGRYNILRSLGSGGMGHVYLARDEVLDRDVALKVLWERLAESEEFVERFRREARSAGALSHPNIVSVYDQGRAEDGTYYIAMEHVGGGTLKERIVDEGPLAPREAADVAIRISEALGAAHRGGVIHRDIKPHNILLTDSGEVKVVDFGIARAVSQASMTGTSFILGTAHYLSPEQAKGEPTGPGSDLYALGVVLYEMLTGDAPYEAESPIAVALKHVSAPPASPREANPEVSEAMDAIVVRLLSKDPADRHADTDELIEDLRLVREGHSPAWVSSPKDEKPVSETGTSRDSSSAPSTSGGRAVWHRRRLRWLLPVALVMLAAASLITAFGGPGSFNNLYKISGEPAKKQPVSKISVPKVVGDKQEAAVRSLRELGFKVTVEKKESKDKEKGRVLSQKPGEGGKVERGSKITLAVGKGPSLVETPDLHGLTLTEAGKKLQKAGLKLGKEKESHSDSLSKGKVLDQSVRAKEKVEKGKSVDVTVSSGPKQKPEKTQSQKAEVQAPTPQTSQTRKTVAEAPAPAPQPVQQAPVPQTVQQAPAPAPSPPVQQAPQPQAPAAPATTTAPSTQQQQVPVQQAPSQQPQTVRGGVSSAPAAGSVQTTGKQAGPTVTPNVVVPKVTVPKVPDIQVNTGQGQGSRSGGS